MRSVMVATVRIFTLIIAIVTRMGSAQWQRTSFRYNGPIPQEIMVDVINSFGLALLQVHNENNENNIAFSPYGAVSVLVAIAEGVEGSALQEIICAANLPLDVAVTRVGLRDIHRHLKSYFIPQEGFLAGLTFSHDNITLKGSYEDLLRFYGYNMEAFNSRYYPTTQTTETTFTTPVQDESRMNASGREGFETSAIDVNLLTTTETLVPTNSMETTLNEDVLVRESTSNVGTTAKSNTNPVQVTTSTIVKTTKELEATTTATMDTTTPEVVTEAKETQKTTVGAATTTSTTTISAIPVELPETVTPITTILEDTTAMLMNTHETTIFPETTKVTSSKVLTTLTETSSIDTTTPIVRTTAPPTITTVPTTITAEATRTTFLPTTPARVTSAESTTPIIITTTSAPTPETTKSAILTTVTAEAPTSTTRTTSAEILTTLGSTLAEARTSTTSQRTTTAPTTSQITSTTVTETSISTSVLTETIGTTFPEITTPLKSTTIEEKPTTIEATFVTTDELLETAEITNPASLRTTREAVIPTTVTAKVATTEVESNFLDTKILPSLTTSGSTVTSKDLLTTTRIPVNNDEVLATDNSQLPTTSDLSALTNTDTMREERTTLDSTSTTRQVNTESLSTMEVTTLPGLSQDTLSLSPSTPKVFSTSLTSNAVTVSTVTDLPSRGNMSTGITVQASSTETPATPGTTSNIFTSTESRNTDITVQASSIGTTTPETTSNIFTATESRNTERTLQASSIETSTPDITSSFLLTRLTTISMLPSTITESMTRTIESDLSLTTETTEPFSKHTESSPTEIHPTTINFNSDPTTADDEQKGSASIVANRELASTVDFETDFTDTTKTQRIGSVQFATDTITTSTSRPRLKRGLGPALKKRRSLVDFLAARFYDDMNAHNFHNHPPHTHNKPIAFLVNGKRPEYNISFMTYDVFLPFCYMAHLNAMALRFPLDSTQYYLLLVLPVDNQGIDDLISRIKSVRLAEIVYNLHPTRVKATIPSFHLQGYVVLTSSMQKLGIMRIFEPRRADFSKLTEDKNIFVTNIEQAVTVVIRNYMESHTRVQDSQVYDNLVEFRVDHPFLYFVMDSELNVALVAGKVINPLNSRIL